MHRLKYLIAFITITATTLAGVFLLQSFIHKKTVRYISSNIETLTKKPAVIILGARVYQDGRMSTMLQDRVDTALDIYKAQKAQKILVSGDHGQSDYDEVNTIKDYLLKKDIPPHDIFLDHAGFDTYDSLYRAREIFGLQNAHIVSQQFHLPRALFIGQALGLNITGIPADRHIYFTQKRNELRELFANGKAFFNILLKSSPKFLGESIDITGDGQKSWD